MNEFEGMNPSDLGIEMHRFAAEIYPICRSITGEGIREIFQTDSEVYSCSAQRSCEWNESL